MRKLPGLPSNARARFDTHQRGPIRHLSASRLPLLFFFLSMAISAHTQSVPVQTASPLYTPFSIPKVRGSLQYSVSGSERETFGYDGGNQTDTSGALSGSLAFLSPSILRPFSMVYSGGYALNTVGQTSQFFQNLSLSQGYNSARWQFNVSDSVAYLPETPTTGLSGIPGVGDVGVSTGTDLTQQILTPNATRVSNTVSGSLGRNLTGKTSLSGSGSYSIQRFLGSSNALQTDSLGAGGALSRRLDGRTSVSASYNFGQSSYVGQLDTFDSQGASFTYSRSLTRRLSFSAGAGPEFLSSTSPTGSTSSISYNANVSVAYSGSVASAASLNASYVRAANSGFGTSFGALTDTFSLSASRRITRALQPSVQVSYAHTAGLSGLAVGLGFGPELDSNTFIASAQVNRAITRVTSVYVSYTALHQTYSGSFQGLNPFLGFSQTLAFGITYSPGSIHVGRQ